MRRYPRVLPLGDSALTIELGDSIDLKLNARVRALDRSLLRDPFPGFLEAVPSYRSLLVCYDARVAGAAEVGDALLARASATAPEELPGRLHRIPTVYGGEDGPDLEEVAAASGLSPAEVVALHASAEYTAYMLGFMPGFAYLGPLPDALETPRRATPRVRVPEGSVAVAGRQTAVYPVSCPGGWNLLGRTSLRLFDPRAEPPALIQPGDRVRFVAVRELPPREEATRQLPRVAAPALEVLDGGLLTTVQDGGRRGYRRLGVSGAGPMDAAAFEAANRAVGNPPWAAGLECTVRGPVLRLLATVSFAVAGADLGAVLERSDLGTWPVPPGAKVLGRPGNVLAFTGRRSGCRAFVAFAGGIDVPVVLGARATDLAGGFGGLEGRLLRDGDLLSLEKDRGETTSAGRRAPELPPRASVRVVLGPQEDHFSDEARRLFLSETYLLAATSDRVGCRLEGPRLEHRGPAEILTDGMVPGSVQVPPDGQPIVMMADGPTTGGYPKIATVVTADLKHLAQLVPGEGAVRFEAVSVEEARRALRETFPSLPRLG